MDTLAQALEFAAELVARKDLQGFVDGRYAGWNAALGREILDGKHTLADLDAWVRETGADPQPVSGRQEALENLVRRALHRSS